MSLRCSGESWSASLPPARQASAVRQDEQWRGIIISIHFWNLAPVSDARLERPHARRERPTAVASRQQHDEPAVRAEHARAPGRRSGPLGQPTVEGASGTTPAVVRRARSRALALRMGGARWRAAIPVSTRMRTTRSTCITLLDDSSWSHAWNIEAKAGGRSGSTSDGPNCSTRRTSSVSTGPGASLTHAQAIGWTAIWILSRPGMQALERAWHPFQVRCSQLAPCVQRCLPHPAVAMT